jgi:hypothetical protein
LEVQTAPGGLVWRLMGADGRNDKALSAEGLGRAQVYEEELRTILVGIDATLNSRPIIQFDDIETLTPAHFLAGGKMTTIRTSPSP